MTPDSSCRLPIVCQRCPINGPDCPDIPAGPFPPANCEFLNAPRRRRGRERDPVPGVESVLVLCGAEEEG